MALVLAAAPAIEPVSIAEAKTHLRLDHADDDGLLSSLILTSRLHIETALGLALITQSWSYFRDAWPAADTVELPIRPVSAITAIRVYDAADVATVLLPSTYSVDASGNPARLALKSPATPPKPGRALNGIEIAFTAGFGATAASVPAPLRQAILLLVAHWYEHRTPYEEGRATPPIPHSVTDLVAPWRPIRL
jgi:uncharacterized phiE125 gp8 family phage protein